MWDGIVDFFAALFSKDGMQQLIGWGGTPLLAGIIFAETGLFIGFFLPGDSLLMAAGVMCAINPLDKALPAPLSFWVMVPVLIVAAIAGNWVNYLFGRYTGEQARHRPDGRFFKRRYLVEAEQFYARWGWWAVVASRFIPVARTFVPFVAGMAGMSRRRYLIATVLGAIAWVGSLCTLGMWLAGFDTLVQNLHYLVLAVIAVSMLPVAIGVTRKILADRRAARIGVTSPRAGTPNEPV